MEFSPHFLAAIRIYGSDDGGPSRGHFSFPETGLRHVPMEFPGVAGLNTVSLLASPNTQIMNGESYRVSCRVLWEEGIAPAVREGVEFRLWGDGTRADHFFASGRVIKVFPENWAFPVSAA